MAIYRFRVILEENEDVYRDIDIKSVQTYQDLHTAIQEAFKFDNKHGASFFVSDDYWRKGQEITLLENDLAQDPEDIKKNIPAKKLMSAVKVAKYIDDPHQRFVYVFDPAAQWSFMIELIKIDNENPKLKYPSCTKSVGTAPKQYKQQPVIKEELTGDMALAALLSNPKVAEEEDDDGEAYKTPLNTEEHGVEDDDLNALEGEEGDEEEGQEDSEFGGDEEGDDSGSFGSDEDEH